MRIQERENTREDDALRRNTPAQSVDVDQQLGQRVELRPPQTAQVTGPGGPGEHLLALRIVAAGAHDDDQRRRFDDLLNLLGDRLVETDVRAEAWR